MRQEEGERQSFGDLLRRARRLAGLTQEELAEQAGLSARGISDLERGVRRSPRQDTLELLVQALQLSEAEQQQWRRVRRNSSRSDPSPVVPMMASADLIGRERECGLLREAIEQGISSRGQVIMLTGEPGVGKTRLAEDLSAYARSRDVWVLWGRSHEGEGAPAYWPWVQVIRPLVDSLAPDVLRRDLRRGASAIAQVIPEVRDKLPGLTSSHPPSPERARFELFDSVARFLHSASLRVPLLLILDDLHWADQSSLELLSFLGQEISPSRILVLGAFRDTELVHAPSLARTATELSRGRYGHQIYLEGLSRKDVGRLIERILNRVPDETLVSAVHERTEGNPFFVGELARVMDGTGRAAGGESDNAVLTTIPLGVKGALEQRYRRLSDQCHAALVGASVIGREFNLGALEAITSETRNRLLPALDEALRARLIERMGGSVGRYRFSHALVRETLYESLPTLERASLHQQAGEFLERAHAGELGPYLSTLAHHFFEAIPASDPDKATIYAIQAGDRAASQFAHSEAASHYRQSLEAIHLVPPNGRALRCEVLLKLGEACNQAGEYRAAQDAFERAAGISRELHLPEHLARAAVGAAGLGVIEHGETRHLKLLEDAVDVLPNDANLLRSQVLARLSIVLPGPDTLEQRWKLVDAAEAIARDLGDASALLYALLAKHRSLWAPGLRAERIAVAREFSSLVEEAGEQVSVPTITYGMYDHLEVGEIPEVDARIEHFTNLVRELRQPQRLWIATNFRTMRSLMDGRFDEAERLIDEARAIGQPAAPTLAVEDHFMFSFFLCRERGRLGEIADSAQQIGSWYPDDLFWQSLLTVLTSTLHNTWQPHLTLEGLVGDIERFGSKDGNAIAAAALLATSPEIAERPEYATRLYDVLCPYHRTNAILGNSRHFHCLGSISHPLGLLASVVRQWDAAEQHFNDAVEMHSQMGAVPYLAHSRYDYSRMLAKRDDVGDRTRAQSLAAAAYESAELLGMSVLAHEAARFTTKLTSG